MSHLCQLDHGSGRSKGRHRVDFLKIMRAFNEAAPALLEVLVYSCDVDGPVNLDSVRTFSVQHL